MDFFDAVKKRASVRDYRDEKIDRRVIAEIVDAGRRAPTARAIEPWEFVVIENKEILGNIAGIAANGSFIKNAAAAVAVFCKNTKYYLEDGVAATENILLSACAHDLGACWIAGDKKDYARKIAGLLGVPEDLKLVSIISLGKPAKEATQGKRRKLEEVMHWEKFNQKGE